MADYTYIPPEGSYAGALGVVPTVSTAGGMAVPTYTTQPSTAAQQPPMVQNTPVLPAGHQMSSGDYYGYQAVHPASGEVMTFPTGSPVPPIIRHPRNPYAQYAFQRRPVMMDPRVAYQYGAGGRYVPMGGGTPAMQMHGYTVEPLIGYPSAYPHVLNAERRDYAAPWNIGAHMYDPNFGQYVAAMMLPAMMGMMGQRVQQQTTARVRGGGGGKGGTAKTPAAPTAPAAPAEERTYGEGVDYTRYRQCVESGNCPPDPSILPSFEIPASAPAPTSASPDYVPLAAGGGVLQDPASWTHPSSANLNPQGPSPIGRIDPAQVQATVSQIAAPTVQSPLAAGASALWRLMGGSAPVEEE